MNPLSIFPKEGVTTIFTDIDDTLTTQGKLGSTAYQALTALQQAGKRVIPVTGRPAGWCDHIARMWPVDGIIGENGAFYMWYDSITKKLHTRHLLDEKARQENTQKLATVRTTILKEVSGCALASDQSYRLYDLAIDFCEDVAPLPQEAVERIVAIMTEAGMTAKVSSIHVNGWFGKYDKLSMTKCMMRERYDIDIDIPSEKRHCAFIGDSPNDAPMFAYFPLSVGVANVAHFKESISHLPQYITPSACGEGFAEFAQHLL